MKNKHMIRTLAVLLAVMLCMTAFFYGRFCKWRGYSSHLRGTDGTD